MTVAATAIATATAGVQLFVVAHYSLILLILSITNCLFLQFSTFDLAAKNFHTKRFFFSFTLSLIQLFDMHDLLTTIKSQSVS